MDREFHTGSWAAAPFPSPDFMFSRGCGAISESPAVTTDPMGPASNPLLRAAAFLGRYIR
jgi:hypothetical protein